MVLGIDKHWYEWDLSAAEREFRRGIELDPDNGDELWGALGHAYALAGRRAEAQQVLRQLENIAKERYVAPYNVALVHLGLGEKDAAFAWLERAFEARSYLLAVYLNTDARLKDLYEDPRYRSLHSRMRLPALK